MVKSLTPRRIVTAGGTLICALGVGYVMQLAAGNSSASTGETPSDAVQAPVSTGAVVPVPKQARPATPELQKAVAFEEAKASEVAVALTQDDWANVLDGAGGDDLDVENIRLTSAAPDTPNTGPHPAALPDKPVKLALLGDEPIATPPSEEAVPEFACDITMSATPVAAALVEVQLSADCLADTQFTLHHNGLMFTAMTDADGNWTENVPALAREALFIAAFDNDEGAVATADVDTLAFYDRYVVQWQGESGLQIHAMEYGASYGDAGHVWHEAARDMAVAATGEGGFMVRLGEGSDDTIRMAEIYTFPTQTAQRTGDVSLSLEAEVKIANCGRDIEAQALMKSGETALTARDLTLAMPECDAVGDFLVLKNLYEDLTIARN